MRLRGTRRAATAAVLASSAQAEPSRRAGRGEGRSRWRQRQRRSGLVRGDDREAVRAQVRQGPRRGHLRRGQPGAAADKTGQFTVSDKVLATSAVFGEIWPAVGYGQTMYCIRQRVGPLYLMLERRFGKWDGAAELTEKEIIRAERNSGVISNRVREIQLQNYQRKMEQKMQREEDLRVGLRLYKDGKYEEALEKFESVLGSKPEINEASIASYNADCCYSKLDRIQAGLSALQDALKAGYEDFKRIRTDPDLANLRKSEEFEPLLKNYDESFINENAINAIKSLFGFGKK